MRIRYQYGDAQAEAETGSSWHTPFLLGMATAFVGPHVLKFVGGLLGAAAESSGKGIGRRLARRAGGE